ncbi:MAG: response regulator [Chloroflexi bacterium]|nr:response regulator [Chloroflexota bacterium]
MLQTQHCSLHSADSGDAFELALVMPEAQNAIVFVVDDNRDLVHYYQRCTAGTPYRIIHIPRGREIFPALERQRPDAIVLDLMLPDVDGWEILGQLHEHPLSRTVPVIVCSVVREAELALTLGATVFLAKPVKRQQFLEALAQVINPAA